MNPTILIPPYAEPVHLMEMKNHLKQEIGVTDDDALIFSQMIAARDVVETGTGSLVCRRQAMVATTFKQELDYFPGYGFIQVPCVPLVSVASITYTDMAGATQTLSSTVYTVNLSEGRIYLNTASSWPSARYYQEDKVVVQFVAGLAAPFTALAATDVLTFWGRSFTVGDRVRVMNSGGQLPAPLQAGADYFVITGGKLSLTLAGAAVDITTTGSGTHFIATDLTAFESGRAAIKLQVGKLYFNRGDAGYDSRFDNTQRAIDGLIASIHAG